MLLSYDILTNNYSLIISAVKLYCFKIWLKLRLVKNYDKMYSIGNSFQNKALPKAFIKSTYKAVQAISGVSKDYIKALDILRNSSNFVLNFPL